jgi:hypothetical protein
MLGLKVCTDKTVGSEQYSLIGDEEMVGKSQGQSLLRNRRTPSPVLLSECVINLLALVLHSECVLLSAIVVTTSN